MDIFKLILWNSCIVGAKKSTNSSLSGSSRISTNSLKSTAERLKQKSNRESTRNSYLNTWRRFNDFVIRLDVKPTSWEERAYLFAAYLVDRGIQSNTVRSYMSAIKRILVDDGYMWNDQKLLLSSLTRACKLINDRVRTRLPIQLGLLELLLFEVQRYFKGKQPYLENMYLALFSICYYGLLGVGEVCNGPHVIKVMNVHTGINKNKILLLLYSSKTHDSGGYLQEIRITTNENYNNGAVRRNFCPFRILNNYIRCRQAVSVLSRDKQLFIFGDKTPVSAEVARKFLRTLLNRLGLNGNLYGMHSFRIGRCSDMIKFGATLEQAKKAGRWKSNAVYRCLR